MLNRNGDHTWHCVADQTKHQVKMPNLSDANENPTKIDYEFEGGVKGRRQSVIEAELQS